MADINKSIQINVEADLKHLLNNLQKMPNMTKKEAEKMVKELSSELKKAEIAAKRTAEANERSFKNISSSANQASKSVSNFRRETSQLGGAISATGDLIGELDPALGSTVVSIQMAGTAVRDLGKAFLTGNPYVLAAVVAVAALTAAYMAYTASAREVEESQNRLQEAIKNTNERIAESKKAFDSAEMGMLNNAEKLNQLRIEYQLLTGQITKSEFAEFERMQQAAKFADQQQSNFEAQKRALFEQEAARNNELLALKAHKETLATNNKLYKEANQLTDEGKEIEAAIAAKRQELLILDEQQADLKLNGQARINQSSYEYEELLNKIARATRIQEANEKALQERREAAGKAGQALAKFITKSNNERIQQEAERLALNQKLESNISKERAKSLALDNENRRSRIALIDDQLQKDQATLELEADILNQKIEQIELEKKANLELATTIEQIGLAKQANLLLDEQVLAMQEGLAIKQQALSKNRIDDQKKEGEQNKLTGLEIAGFYATAAHSVAELIKTVGGENKKAALIAFRVSQAAALAEIAINTAKNIAEVALNPFAVAAVSVIGAAQAATVAMQKPPEFHMGGMIGGGEDTTQITALKGEAILDRRTVSRLGGERGVEALQRGNNPNSNQVIVIQPYKHFDRFIRSNQKRGGIMSKLNKVNAAGAY